MSDNPFVGSNELIFVSGTTCRTSSPPHLSVSIFEEDPLDNDYWGTHLWPPHEYGRVEELWKGGDRKMWIEFICR